MPAELAPAVDFFDVVPVDAAGFLCLTVPPVRGATLFPGLFAAPTDVELAGAGIFLSLNVNVSKRKLKELMLR